MTTPLTGDINLRVEVAKRGVTLHNFPQVTTAQLADIADPINQKAISGKRLGGQVMVVDSIAAPTTAAIYVASGSTIDAPWVPIADVLGSGAAPILPV